MKNKVIRHWEQVEYDLAWPYDPDRDLYGESINSGSDSEDELAGRISHLINHPNIGHWVVRATRLERMTERYYGKVKTTTIDSEMLWEKPAMEWLAERRVAEV